MNGSKHKEKTDDPLLKYFRLSVLYRLDMKEWIIRSERKIKAEFDDWKIRKQEHI